MLETIQIESLKANHKRHRLWKENYILFQDDQKIIGYNDRTEVEQWNGKVVATYVPALFYFEYDTWFNVIYIMDQYRPFFYCNLSSPITFDGHQIQYIDYDIDIIVTPDYSYKVVDEDEFFQHGKTYQYSESLVTQVNQAKQAVIQRIEARQAPFNDAFLQLWLNQVRKIMQNRGK